MFLYNSIYVYSLGFYNRKIIHRDSLVTLQFQKLCTKYDLCFPLNSVYDASITILIYGSVMMHISKYHQRIIKTRRIVSNRTQQISKISNKPSSLSTEKLKLFACY